MDRIVLVVVCLMTLHCSEGGGNIPSSESSTPTPSTSSAFSDSSTSTSCTGMGMSLTFRDSPSNSTDAMGAYRVDNLHQCERLCWYRSPCTSYSFRPANSSLDEEENCLLHSASVEDSPDRRNSTNSSMISTTTTAATATTTATSNISAAYLWNEDNTCNPYSWNYRLSPLHPPPNGCSSRPCSPLDYCLPIPNVTHSHPPSSPFLCVSANVTCPDHVDQSIGNGSVTVNGTTQGNNASVVCSEFFVLSPRESLGRVTCQVNGRWSTFADRCVQYLWPRRSALADVTRFLFVDFPRRLGEGEGWGMCVKGKMAATDRMFLNFMSQPYNDGMYSELPLHVDLRFAGAVYNSLNESGWRGLTDLGEMPIRHGADYQVSLHAAGSRLHVTLAGLVTYLIPLDHGPEVKYRIDLSHVRYLWMGDVLELSYLNLIDKCDDIL